jgi:homoserine O-acetyltransferase/O-succinyltransferase
MVALFVLSIAASLNAQEQQFANLGDFKLESGEVLRDCRLGYRTLGQLNADKSNAILFPTWAGGTTERLAGSVGAGKLADSTKYFVILVDALSNGASSSPSNSQLQPHMQFPKITFHDMIATQHELLTKFLHVDHIKGGHGNFDGRNADLSVDGAVPRFHGQSDSHRRFAKGGALRPAALDYAD